MFDSQVEIVQPESALERLSNVLKSVHLLPYYNQKQVINEGSPNAEYVMALMIGGIVRLSLRQCGDDGDGGGARFG